MSTNNRCVSLPDDVVHHVIGIIKARGLSLYKVAEAAGYDRTMIYRWETRRLPPTFQSFLDVCTVLQVRVAIVELDKDYAPAHLSTPQSRGIARSRALDQAVKSAQHDQSDAAQHVQASSKR